MKIKGTGQDLSTTNDAVKILSEKKSSQAARANGGAQDNSDDVRVNVALGAYINNEFESTKSGADRRQKIEELKELIRQGKYKPDSHAVAAALGEEITFSILTEGGSTGE